MTSVGIIGPTVKVGGNKLSKAQLDQFTLMRIERGFGLVGRATLRLRDGGYGVSATNAFALGTDISISTPEGTLLFQGTVTGIDLEQVAGDITDLIVVVDDAAFKLARGTQITTYTNVGYGEVIRQMANRHGLTPQVDSMAGTFEYLLQAGSDLAFLNQIVERTGHVWWIEGEKTLMVKNIEAGGPDAKLTLGEDLLEFSVRASGLRPTEFEVNGWNPDQQQNVSGANGPATTSPPALVTNYVGSKPASALTAAKATLADPPPLTVEEAKTMANGLFADAAAGAVVARGLCRINERVVPGATVQISEAGPASGNYVVSEVTHVWGDGQPFRTQFTAGPRRPAALVDTLGAPPADPGFLSAGLVIGVITDNADKSGRVKVKYAGIGGEVESPWARVVTMGGGASRGVVFQPEVGDEVLVGFERGDTRRPVVLGGLFSEKNQLPTAGSGVEQGKVDYRRMTSRKAHIIEFGDGEGPDKQHLLIQLGTAQHKLRLGADRFDIEVAQGKPITIKSGNAMFDINAAGNISIEGKNVTIKADGTLLLSGGTKASLESNNQTAVQGTQVQVKANATGSVEAGGPLTVKGATVAIN